MKFRTPVLSMVFVAEDIVAVNFVGKTAAVNFLATGVLVIVAECAAVATNLIDYVETENSVAIVTMK